MESIIPHIINNNINFNKPDNDGNLLLHILVNQNKINEITELLKYNPTIIYKNKDGDTPLCIAKKNNNQEITELLENYCNLNNINYSNIPNNSSSESLCSLTHSSDEAYLNDEFNNYSSMSSSITSNSSNSSNSSESS